MREIIFNSGTADTLHAEATRLGFVDADGNLIVNSTFTSGGGWYLNVVGTVYEPMAPPTNPEGPWPDPVAREGYWGRLRLNGTPETMPTFSNAITQYVWSEDLGGWTDDGTTLAPEWVGLIGVIA